MQAPARSYTTTFTVTWGATDTQAGVAWYDLDVSVDGGEWQRVLTHTLLTSRLHTCPLAHFCIFRVTATDHVSNAASALARTSIPRITKYYHHGGTRVALRTTTANGSVVYWLHTDHLGSVSLITDHASRVIAQRRFLPYGGERYSEGTFPTDVGFTGQRGQAGLGLVFMRARYYHPRLGRFVSADTVVAEPGNPQALNRFSYVLGNPCRYVDPTGHCLNGALRNEDAECWDTYYKVFSKLGTSTPTDLWTWSTGQLQELLGWLDRGFRFEGGWTSAGLADAKQGLGWILNAVGDWGIMAAIFGMDNGATFTFAACPACDPNRTSHLAFPWDHRIVFDNGNPGVTNLLHEAGHVVDWYLEAHYDPDRDDASSWWSQGGFVGHGTWGWEEYSPQLREQMAENGIRRWHYIGGKCYSQANPVEDFADSFAAWVLVQNQRPLPSRSWAAPGPDKEAALTTALQDVPH